MAKQGIYMPLYIGDWFKGTLGMKSEVKGVYVGLLLFQWDNGFIPADIEELVLIEPEVKKVWDRLSHKFAKISETRLQNGHLEEIRAFWNKQKDNGSKGGRPKKENPNNNPKPNPNNNLHSELEYDIDINTEEGKEGPGEKPKLKLPQNFKTQIGVDFWDHTPSEHLMLFMQSFTETQLMLAKMDKQEVLFKFDNENTYTHFTTERHFQNAFKAMIRKMQQEKSSGFTHHANGQPKKESKFSQLSNM